MRIAIAGKGGTGKTTLAAALARALTTSDRPVLAIDADPTPNLAISLGLPREQAMAIVPIPTDVSQMETDASGKKRRVFRLAPDEIVRRYGVDAPGPVRLVVMGRVEHAGSG